MNETNVENTTPNNVFQMENYRKDEFGVKAYEKTLETLDKSQLAEHVAVFTYTVSYVGMNKELALKGVPLFKKVSQVFTDASTQEFCTMYCEKLKEFSKSNK